MKHYLVVCIPLFLLGVTSSLAQFTVRPNEPDFYQHQPGINNAQPGISDANDQGWCYQTSFADAMYHLALTVPNALGGLFPNPGGAAGWLADTVNNVDTIVTGGVNNYLNTHGGGGLVFSTYTTAVNGDLYPIYQAALQNPQEEALVKLKDNGSHGWWWSPTFHWVDGVGLGADRQIAVADPDNTVNSSAANRADTMVLGMMTQRYNTAYLVGDLLPVGGNGDVGTDQYSKKYYEPMTFNAAGLITSGAYTGATITDLLIIEVPEPSAAALLALGALSLALTSRRRKFIS